jgi:hypothetical protein
MHPTVIQLRRHCLAGILLIGLAAGCTQIERTPSSSSRNTVANRPVNVINEMVAPSNVSHYQAVIQPLGVVDYDNLTLPMVSPDGKYVATPVGAPPTLDALLAEPDASIPYESGIEIYRLEPNRGDDLAFVARINPPALLGRACDSDGFLIEMMREDGSRHIGMAAWATGAITWLVQDASVNAHATLGPQGQLAWCRRSVNSEHFDLVVQRGEDLWTVPAMGSDWLFPTFCGADDGLCAIQLTDDRLLAVHGNARTSGLFQQSSQRLTLMTAGARRWSAYQTQAGSVAVVGGPLPTADQWFFFSIPDNRPAVWQPLKTGRSRGALFDPTGYTVLPMNRTEALVATDTQLVVQNINHPAQTSQLLNGLLIPRSTPLGELPFVLLKPMQGRIAISAFKPVTADEAMALSELQAQ